MQLSAKTHNACLAMIELARRDTNPQPVCLKTIAEEQQISPQFLVQILLQLKRAGLVRSTRGAAGGYRLSKRANEIHLLDILQAMDGNVASDTSSKTTGAAAVLSETWQTLTQQHCQSLASISLRSLADRVPNRSGDMYYI